MLQRMTLSLSNKRRFGSTLTPLRLAIPCLMMLLCTSGCAWLGIERLKPTEVDIRDFYARNVIPTRQDSREIKLGMSLSAVTAELGEPQSVYTDSEGEMRVYPSNRQIKTGSVLCLGIIPIPNRTVRQGEYHLFFRQNILTRITSLETQAGFHGVYMDDSGSGSLHGEKSKCNI